MRAIVALPAALLPALVMAEPAALTTPPTAAVKPPAGVDAFGDPLPPGAVARLGTVRFRVGMWPQHIAASPDGSKLVTVGSHVSTRTGLLTVWDAATGRPLREVPVRGAEAQWVRWLPDGRGLVLLKVGRTDYRVWQFTDAAAPVPAADPAEVGTITLGTFTASAPGPDGRRVAAGLRAGDGGTAGRVAVWRAEPNGLVGSSTAPTWAIDLPDAVVAVYFTPDGKRLIGVTENRQEEPGGGPGPGPVKVGGRRGYVWDAASGRQQATFEPPTGYVAAFAVAPDGATFYAAGGGRVFAFDLATGKPARSFPVLRRKGEEGAMPAQEVGVTPDGKTLLVVNDGAGFVAYDPATGAERWRETGHGAGYVPCFAVLPDGRRFAVAGRNGAITFGDTGTGRVIDGHPGPREAVVDVVVSADGRTATTTGDGVARRWDLASGRELGATAARDYPRFFGASVSPDGRTVVGNGGETVYHTMVATVDALTGRTGRVLNPDIGGLSPRMTGGRPIGWLPDGPVVLDGRTTRAVRYDRAGAAGTTYTPAGVAGGGRAMWVEASPDGRTLVLAGVRPPGVGERTGWVAAFDAGSGKQLGAWSHPTQFNGAAFTPDGRALVLTGYTTPTGPPDGRRPSAALVFDIETGEFRFPLADPPAAADVRWPRTPAVAPNGYQAAVAENDHSLTVYEVATGVIRRRLAGHRNGVNRLAFTPDGRRLVSASADGTGLVWDVGPRAPPGPVRTADADRLKRWEALGSSDAPAAEAARGELAADPAGTVALAGRHLKAAPPPPTDAEVDGLIARLGADGFADREAATKALDRLGRDAVRRAKARLGSVESPEARRRLGDFVGRHDGPSGPLAGGRLHERRAVEVLEVIGTTEAKAVLKGLADGPAGAALTRDAAAALDRLAAAGR